MKLALHPFELPLRHPFGISRGTRHAARTLIVSLEQDGVTGYGEATANRYYGVTVESITAALERVRPTIESTAMDAPTVFWRRMHPTLAEIPFAQCALDGAAHDLWGSYKGSRSGSFGVWTFGRAP